MEEKTGFKAINEKTENDTAHCFFVLAMKNLEFNWRCSRKY